MRTHLRLRTKLLLAMVVVSAATTAVTLVLVSRTVDRQERRRISQDLRNSVIAFENAEHQREAEQARAASLIADLPIVRALMTTRDSATIQDASAEIWRVAGSDLFVIASQDGRVLALHASTTATSVQNVQELFRTSLRSGEEAHLWLAEGHLYEVALRPIYFGPASANAVLGHVALGFEVDERVVHDLSEISGSQVAFRSRDAVIRSTLSPEQQRDLGRISASSLPLAQQAPAELRLGGERYLATAVPLNPGAAAAIDLVVLKSVDEATSFLTTLNRMLLLLGVIAVLAGSTLIFLISHTVTRPLGSLLAGLGALGRGDYRFPLPRAGRDEVGELTLAFDLMRRRVQEAQRELLEAERLATIGQMASSISHDLRHHLAAVYANAEFLLDSRRSAAERKELYEEVRGAVLEMTELIESLLEFSRTSESLRKEHSDITEALEHAISAVRLHHQYQSIQIDLQSHGNTDGYFDAKKLERVFQNLLLNACAAAPPRTGLVRVTISGDEQSLLIRLADNGAGIPDAVRTRIFEPFFTYGKENGTGLGLNVALKIVQDHGGELELESTSPGGSVFKVTLPRGCMAPYAAAPNAEARAQR